MEILGRPVNYIRGNIFIAFIILLATLSVIISNAHSLAFSIYENNTLLPQYKVYYANATSKDILIDDEYSNPPRVYLSYYNQPQLFPRLILANNYSELTSSISSPYVNDVNFAKAYNFSRNDYIGYGPEDWALTP